MQRKPYINIGILEKHYKDLEEIEDAIYTKLKDYENFDGIDFVDVHAGGINIRGHHKKISGYCYPSEQPKLKYDFSNKDSVIDEFVDLWKKSDTEHDIKGFKEFIFQGEKYGWD